MKKIDLAPTIENIENTFINDSIGRNTSIKDFIMILNSLEDCYSIALDSYWGSGKTFFVKQTKMILDLNNPAYEVSQYNSIDLVKQEWDKINKNTTFSYKPHLSIYYDAWENDNDEDPIFSIIYQMIQQTNTEYYFEEGILRGIIDLAAGVVETFTGLKITKIAESITKLKEKNEFSELKDVKNLKGTIDAFLNAILVERGERLIIFIDELDRCKPSYAVKLLERIKHYFNNELVTFVFSVNIDELQHTIKRFYGDNFNACKYLDRFFDLRISLPTADMKKFYEGIGFEDSRYYYDLVCASVINKFNLQLREIAKYIQLTQCAAYKPAHSDDVYLSSVNKFVLYAFVPILIGLKITNSTRYANFVNGKDYTPLLEVLTGEDYVINFCRPLLNRDESYEKNDGNLMYVKLEDKLIEAYNSIFQYNYQNNYSENIVGQLGFGLNTKNNILKIINLMSNFTDLNDTYNEI